MFTQKICSKAARALAMAVFAVLSLQDLVHAQVGFGWDIPDPGHYRAKAQLYSGYYNDAGKSFRNLSRSGIKTAQSRWIDGICADAMLGECYYQNGDYEQALAAYESALELFIAYPDWMMMLQLSEPLVPAGPASSRAMPWGRSRLPQAQFAAFPRNMTMQWGRVSNILNLQTGQLNQQAKIIPCDAEEVVRCTCLAIRRRGEILGPLAEFDDSLRGALSALEKKPGVQNHWTYAWIRLQLGLAYAAVGKKAQAIDELQKATLMPQAVLHPLSGLAQLALGKQAELAGDDRAAMAFYEEAAVCAGIYEDLAIVEEALRAAHRLHAANSPDSPYAPLVPAIAWAAKAEWGHIQAWLNTCLADALLQKDLSGLKLALANLADAQALLQKRRIRSGALRAQNSYLTALASIRAGKLESGLPALEKAIQAQQQCSLAIAHAAYIDHDFRSNAITARQAVEFFEQVLADPTPRDWRLDPLDSLARCAMPSEEPYQHWFDAALQRKDENQAWRVSEIIKRRRFLATLPLAGRLLNHAWLLETPVNQLTPQQLDLRKAIEVAYSDYLNLSRTETAAMAEIFAKPVAEVVDAPAKTFAKASAAVIQAEQAKENLLWQMSVGRSFMGTQYPVLADMNGLKKNLPDQWAVLAFFGSKQQMHAVLITKQKHATWMITNPAKLQSNVSALLRQWGNIDPQREIGADIYNDERWRELSSTIYQQIFTGSNVDIAEGIEELVIVPDNFLWYLPFEALTPTDAELPIPKGRQPPRARKPRPRVNEGDADNRDEPGDAEKEKAAKDKAEEEKAETQEATDQAEDKDAAVAKDDAAEQVKNAAKNEPKDGDVAPMLCEVMRVRYAPMLGYAIPQLAVRPKRPSTAVFLGKIYPRDDANQSQRSLQKLKEASPEIIEISAAKAAGGADPRLLAPRMDRLVVWQDWELGTPPRDWVMWQLGARNKTTLQDQLGLPWLSPRWILAPGMQTSAASSILKGATATDGSDLFWTACAMMTSGSQTAVLSRWRVGGESTALLTGEMLKNAELGSTATESWHKAIETLRAAQLEPEQEPRVQRTRKGEKISASHPFFWAGYLLVQSGELPEGDAPPAENDTKAP